MDRLKQIETFAAVATKGSLTAAAHAEGVAPAVIGRRIDALEERLGVKLLTRTTRRITLTHEGGAFLEDCQRLLTDLANAEASVSEGGVKASGHLRITAPAGFGRRHVAPLVPGFVQQHPDVSVSLNLSDRVIDIVNEGLDCAVRVGDLADSSLVSVRLADNRRLCVATPEYLKRHGAPKTPAELSRHECLTLSADASQTRGWAFVIDGELKHLRPHGRIECSDGQVLHDWCLRGLGIAWRSTWEVEQEVASGALAVVLADYAAPPNGIYAVFPQRKHLPLRVRLWIDYIKHTFGDPGYWGCTRARVCVAAVTSLALLAQAFLHVGLALVALLASGAGVATLHLVLLAGLLGRQAGLHEGLAFIALLVGGVFVALGHFALLRVVCGQGRRREQAQGQRGRSDEGFHSDLSSKGLVRALKARPRQIATDAKVRSKLCNVLEWCLTD